MDIYGLDSYKTLIKVRIHENHAVRGYQTILSEKAHCHRSYLTQVVSGKAHLTADQLIRLAQYWAFTQDELNFILDLHSLEKASSPELSQFYQKKIEVARRRRLELSKRLKKKAVQSEKHFLYFSHWLNLAVLTLCLLPAKMQAEEMSRYLSVPLQQVNKVISNLIEMGFLKREKSGYQALERDLHLSNHSPFLPIFLQSWRERAVESSRQGDSRSTHYTSLYTVSKKDFENCREKCLELIEKTRLAALNSQAETEVVCFNIDWFKLG